MENLNLNLIKQSIGMSNKINNPRKEQAVKKWQLPQLLDPKDKTSYRAIETLMSNKRTRFIDPMQYAIGELYDIAYPAEKDLPVAQKSAYERFSESYEWPHGVFVFFPWSDTLVRFPEKEDLRALRTSRNRNLITRDEQSTLYGATVFVAGLSVGSNIVEALVSMGIGSKFILADMDVIEPTNLNRIRAPYQDVGVHKADSIAMRMNEIDPYLEFELLRDGVTEKNLVKMLDEYRPSVIVDEMDQVKLKITLRREAKKRGIAVVSAADDGDSALVDIERYDVDSNYPLFHGLIPEDVLARLESDAAIPRQQLGVLIGKYFVGSEHIPLRMFQSLQEVGKTLPSWPQLGGAATQSGLVIAYAVRQIILGLPLKQGRFVVGPDQVLSPEHEDPGYLVQLQQFKQQLDSFNLS